MKYLDLHIYKLSRLTNEVFKLTQIFRPTNGVLKYLYLGSAYSNIRPTSGVFRYIYREWGVLTQIILIN